jgi:hypothetical protein
MLYLEIISLYCENYTKRMNTLSGQNAVQLNTVACNGFYITIELKGLVPSEYTQIYCMKRSELWTYVFFRNSKECNSFKLQNTKYARRQNVL